MNASHGEPPHPQHSVPHGPPVPRPGPGLPPSGPGPVQPGPPPPGPALPVPPGAGPVQYPADQAFAPGGGLAWSHISKRYTWQQRISALLWAVPVAALGAFLMRGDGWVVPGIWIAVVAVSTLLAWIVAELAYRSYGYAERGDDLIVTSGVFVKRLIVVPYGRMQFVDVTAGLLERWMGIATVRMHTAAAATDARIPGLPAEQASRLRDRLAQKGEERSMGL
ncbi:PH domain-containing protein [Actinomadura kijaniata]|uniref:PH domain-containing protein n=1 Tax=Actinomadura kijaniata TaxID=46161 RepID=UPI0009FEFB4D|nr:PH domain-containing protein [Actinomadura kijaniata]